MCVEAAHAPLVTCAGLALAGQSAVRVDTDRASWPESTQVLCWHCAHAFATPPVPRPVAHDHLRRVFKVQGSYCSWACAAGDCRSQADHRLLQELHQAVHGREVPLLRAPPRCMLQAFGGPLTLEEFRRADRDFKVVPSNLLDVSPVRVQVEDRIRQRNTAPLDLSHVTATNETFKVKREKPLAAGRGLMAAHARIVR